MVSIFSSNRIVLPLLLLVIWLYLRMQQMEYADPNGYYKMLGIQHYGSPHRISTNDVLHAYDHRRSELKAERDTCEHTYAEDEEEVTKYCSEFEAQLLRLEEAVSVLSDPLKKSSYDYNMEDVDYFEVLGVDMNDSVEDMKVAYDSKMSKIRSQMKQLECGEKDETHAEECASLTEQKDLLHRAALVLGDQNSRAVYYRNRNPEEHQEPLSFVSSPQAMVNRSSNPLGFIAPILALMAVLYLIQIRQREYIEDERERELAARANIDREKAE